MLRLLGFYQHEGPVEQNFDRVMISAACIVMLSLER